MAASVDDRVYLKCTTKIEPLSFGFYAWTHLISPAQRALHLVFRLIPLLNSFVRNPHVHAAAANDAKLFGGPFVQLTSDHVEAVENLLRRHAQHSLTLALARDLREFDKKLQAFAQGNSLSELYAQCPDSLRGIVELLYDANDHPKLRIREELLYEDIDEEREQQILMSHDQEEHRAFFMTTPRLVQARDVLFPWSFNDPRIDRLVESRTTSATLAELIEELDVPRTAQPAFSSFFSNTCPRRQCPAYGGSGVRVRYFGHACVLLQTAQESILIDPMLAWETNRDDGRLTFHDLPDRIDHIVISHNHHDHANPETLLQLRGRVSNVIIPSNNAGSVLDPSLKLTLRHMGFKSVQALSTLESVALKGGQITSLPFPGEHVDLDIHSRHGIHVELEGRRFAFLVDSDCCDPHVFRRVARRLGRRLDALFVGMECYGAPLSWLYGPLRTHPLARRNDESRRLSGMNCEQAVRVLQEFEPTQTFVYALGQEPWLRYIMGLEYTPDSIQLKEVAKFLEHGRTHGIAIEHLRYGKEWEV